MDDYSAGGGLAERIEFSAWRLGAGPVLHRRSPLAGRASRTTPRVAVA